MIDIAWPSATGLLFFLLLLSAFFSGSETALTRARRFRLRILAESGNHGASKAKQLLTQPERMLTMILLGNNFVNIAATSLATAVFVAKFGEAGIAYATIAMTMVVLIFAEILPKTVAVAHAEWLSCQVAGPLIWIQRLMYPLVSALMATINFLKHFLGVPKRAESELTRREIAAIIDIGAETGILDKAREQMLANSLSLHEVPVKALMTPKRNMLMLDGSKCVSECLREAIRQPHSRYPVFRGSSDRLIGIVHLRDLIKIHNGQIRLADAMVWQSPPYIPASKNALAQLFDFQIRRQHMAIVVDEYGDIEGLITLEDIIEEIVGDIVDESDQPQLEELWPQPDGSLVVSGTASLHDINQSMDLDLPEEGATTIGGFIVEILGEQPQEKLCISLDGLHIELIEVSGHTIQKVCLRKAEDQSK